MLHALATHAPSALPAAIAFSVMVGGVFTLCLDKFAKCAAGIDVTASCSGRLFYCCSVSVSYKRSNSLHLPQAIRFQVCLLVGSSFVIFLYWLNEFIIIIRFSHGNSDR